VERLLGKGDEAAALYVLRRSASFGFSFLSIARADPGLASGTAGMVVATTSGGGASGNSGESGSSVLEYIMQSLLFCAVRTTMPALSAPSSSSASPSDSAADSGGGINSNSDEWRVGVHALNVLRLVFLDTVVGEAVTQHVPVATKVGGGGSLFSSIFFLQFTTNSLLAMFMTFNCITLCLSPPI
jgi:hypothetical protein